MPPHLPPPATPHHVTQRMRMNRMCVAEKDQTMRKGGSQKTDQLEGDSTGESANLLKAARAQLSIVNSDQVMR
jgi:hypothetical protein